MNKEYLIRQLIIIILVIIVSVILVRSLTGGQTIAEYAYENNIPAHPENTEEDSIENITEK